MLSLPLLLGAVLAGTRPGAAWLLPPAVILVFLAHYALVPIARRKLAREWLPAGWTGRRMLWAALYLVVAGLLFVKLMIFAPGANRTWLLRVSGIAVICGAAYSAASAARLGRLLGTELLGMAAMALSAPIMALAAGAQAGMWMVGAPALAFGYSASALAWVRAYANLERGRAAATLACVAAHVAVLVGLALISLSGWLSPWALFAFVPVIVRTVWGLVSPPPTLKAVGLREIWVALGFAVLAAALI
jgi:hypothetical protein